MTETYDGPFSLLQMFWGSITARPLRSFLSVIAIAIQVILVLMIAGLTSGVISEWGKRVEGVGADILVQPPNASIFFAFLSVGMQESLGEKIAALGGEEKLLPYCNFELNENDVLYMRVASGGGYGDPLERDPALVQKDVANSIVSLDAAREIYGVVLEEPGLRVDLEATRQLRIKMRWQEIEGVR